MKTILIFAALISVVMCEQIVPVPIRTPGVIVLGPTNATFQLEVFFDLQCPDSKAAWPILKQVIKDVQDYGVSLRVHSFPLPFHNQAYLFARGLSFLHLNATTQDVFDYIDYSFEIQDNYSNSAVANLSLVQIVNRLANELATKFSKFTVDQFTFGLTDRAFDLETRTAWKYGCSRGVSGTPSFIGNGVQLNDVSSNDYNGWVNYLRNFVDVPSAQILNIKNKFVNPTMAF